MLNKAPSLLRLKEVKETPEEYDLEIQKEDIADEIDTFKNQKNQIINGSLNVKSKDATVKMNDVRIQRLQDYQQNAQKSIIADVVAKYDYVMKGKKSFA